MPKKLIEIASEIVQSQVSLSSMTAAEISTSLRQVFGTLHELQRAESEDIELPRTQKPAPAQALTPRDSIQEDKIICLECRAEMRQLTKAHLVSHGMDHKEYKKKYGFTMETPLAAKSLIKVRSKMAKKRGLPERLKQYLEARRQKKQEGLLQEKPVLLPENSIQNDKIICLECGAEMKWLTQKHLVVHGISSKEYRKKYGFSMQTPLAAKSLTKDWSKAAKKRGLPENLRRAMDARRQAKAEANTQATTKTVTGGKRNQTRLRKKKA